ncbi:MAG TPA: GyrI-like domain-containing protein, partial [Terriglobales bacterium]|nr:GyrI-like domain-containing protein [Terriglobales bacterium]
ANKAVRGTELNPRVKHQEGFAIVGIAVRTSNAKEATDSLIGRQWGRLMQENLLATVLNKADRNIVAVYTDASDKDGEYTYGLGARVTKVENVPAGMIAKEGSAGRYSVLTSDRGVVQQVVLATWKRIWDTPKDAPGGDRIYKTDFEVYDERARNSADSVMDVHVGIR